MRRAAAMPERTTMTLEDWAALDEDVEGELVDGVLEEEEMPSFLHEIVVAWLIQTLGNWARRRRGHSRLSRADTGDESSRAKASRICSSTLDSTSA